MLCLRKRTGGKYPLDYSPPVQSYLANMDKRISS